MLEHWIQPPEKPIFLREYLDSDRFGAHLAEATDPHEQTDAREIGLIGVDVRWARLVRRHLYQFAYRMPNVRIHDFGDMRKSDPGFMIGPLFELISGGICPVLIGAHFSVLKAVEKCFQHLRAPFFPVVVHENVPESLSHVAGRAFVIGVQQHLLSKNLPEQIQSMHLSHVRNSAADAETLIRQSNACVFDLAAMSAHEMPAQQSLSSSGLCTEEACMLMRHAGLHAGTKLLVMTGHDPRSLQLDICANTAAQMIWYFLEGFGQSIVEDPLKSSHCTSYVVHLDLYDTGFKFFKSERTGRWWVQTQTGNEESVFPCAYQDYLHATNGQVSDRLIRCVNSSLEHSKHTL